MRAHLVGLALDLYRNEGIDAVSFRRIADGAGCSHMLPYRYFEHKEALLVAMRAECTRRFEQQVRTHERAARSPLERIRRVASGYLDYVAQHPRDYQLIFAANQPPPTDYPALLAARRSLFDHAVEVVQGAIDAGDLKGDALALAHMLWVSLHGLISLHVGGQLVHGLKIEDLFGQLTERMLGQNIPAHSVASPARSARRAT